MNTGRKWYKYYIVSGLAAKASPVTFREVLLSAMGTGNSYSTVSLFVVFCSYFAIHYARIECAIPEAK